MEDHANLSRVVLSNGSGFGVLIGESAPMRQLYELIGKVRHCDFPVLLLGETGTGKELVARCIHFMGVRREKIFVPVDCAALTPALVESELFGHVRGAFTGADHSKRGLLQAGNDGTIFLDEIGELPLYLQTKFLRALQEKEIRPVGSTDRIPINVRIVAATNRNLEAEVQKGRFREDLFYRLNVVQITLPPLRQRKSDIPLLAGHFLQKLRDPQQPLHTISAEAMGRLVAYDWPGNVRELENFIQCAVALGSSAILQAKDLPPKLQSVPTQGPREKNDPMALEEITRRAIFRALEETGGDKHAAVRLLGIGKTTLYRKLKEYRRGPLGG